MKYTLYYSIIRTIWNTWQLLNKHGNSLKYGGSFLFGGMNSFSFPSAQNANIESLWSKWTGDALLGQGVTPHWCYCLILLFNATCSRSTHREGESDDSEQGNQKSWVAYWYSDKHEKFPLQYGLYYNIFFLLSAKWLLDSYSLFLDGRNVPRSWQTVHIMWLVLLLLKTGWKCIACSDSVLQAIANEVVFFCLFVFKQLRL